MEELDYLNEGGKVVANVRPFTKIEKMTTKKYKPPRMIQARSISFNIEYGKFIKPIEHYLFKRSKHRHHFGKGNYDEIARRIAKLKKKYAYCTELDHDSFDAHITTEMLGITHKYYLACHFLNKLLRKLCKKTLNNKCKTREGDWYKVFGTRMSGDVDTSLGNSLINYAILKQLLLELGIEGDVIVNGDDSIIFTNVPIDIKRAIKILRKYNMNSKMKESVLNIHQVDFCQSRFVYRSDGTPTMMMDPKRLYSKFGMTYKVPEIYYYIEYLKELALCLGLTHCNTPYGYAWLDLIKGRKFLTNRNDMKLKFVEDSIFSLVERESKSAVSSEEYTISMFEAYPNVLEVEENVKKIRFKIIKMDYNIYINHNHKTIHYHYIVSHSRDVDGKYPEKPTKKNLKKYFECDRFAECASSIANFDGATSQQSYYNKTHMLQEASKKNTENQDLSIVRMDVVEANEGKRYHRYDDWNDQIDYENGLID